MGGVRMVLAAQVQSPRSQKRVAETGSRVILGPEEDDRDQARAVGEPEDLPVDSSAMKRQSSGGPADHRRRQRAHGRTMHKEFVIEVGGPGPIPRQGRRRKQTGRRGHGPYTKRGEKNRPPRRKGPLAERISPDADRFQHATPAR